MRWSLVVLVVLCCAANADESIQTIPSDLLKRLNHKHFVERRLAFDELRKFPEKAVRDAIKVRKLPPEVRVSLARSLSVRDAEWEDAQIRKLLDLEESALPGWDIVKEACGDEYNARGMYAATYQRHRAVIRKFMRSSPAIRRQIIAEFGPQPNDWGQIGRLTDWKSTVAISLMLIEEPNQTAVWYDAENKACGNTCKNCGITCFRAAHQGYSPFRHKVNKLISAVRERHDAHREAD